MTDSAKEFIENQKKSYHSAYISIEELAEWFFSRQKEINEVTKKHKPLLYTKKEYKLVMQGYSWREFLSALKQGED